MYFYLLESQATLRDIMQTKNREVKHIGIVISGGFSRGVAQLAFVKPIVEKIGYERLTVLSGASVGALNCFAISCKRIDELLNFYSNLDLDNLRGFLKAMRGRFYSKAFNVAESDTMHVTTYANATRLIELNPYYFCLNSLNRQEVKKILDASMGFPVLNGRKRFNGSLFFDGGATDNCPCYPLEYFDLDMIIVIHCHAKYYPEESLLRDDRIFVDCDSVLNLDFDPNPLSFDKELFKEMIKVGLNDGKKFADEVFSDFDFDNVKNRCRKYTLDNIEKRRNKTRDLLTAVDITNELYRLKIGR